ncbi:hypothetical protein V8E36_007489 [Tilletia maclaganii]
MATTSSPTPPTMAAHQSGSSTLALCSSYLNHIFQSPAYLTSTQGQTPAETQDRILNLLADPALDQDDRIDAVRSQLDSCLRLNLNSRRSSTEAAATAAGAAASRRESAGSSSTSASTATNIPDDQLDNIVLELMHRLQQDQSGRSSSSFSHNRIKGGAGAASTSFRPPRPLAAQPTSKPGFAAASQSSLLSRTLSSGSAAGAPGSRPSSSSSASLPFGFANLALGAGQGTPISGLNTPLASPRPWNAGPSFNSNVPATTISSKSNDTAFRHGNSVAQPARSTTSPFASPGGSPRLWSQGLPLPLGDAASAYHGTSSLGRVSPSPWSGPPAFTISNSSPSPFNNNTSTASTTATGLQRTSSDLGGEPTSPLPSAAAAALGGSVSSSGGASGIARSVIAPGPPGLSSSSSSSSSTSAQQPFARLATTNAAVKAVVAAAAASASASASAPRRTSAIGSERDELDGGHTPEGGDSREKAATSTTNTGRLPASSCSPERAHANPLGSAGGASVGTDAPDTTPSSTLASGSTSEHAPTASLLSASISSSTASPRLNVAALEFKPRASPQAQTQGGYGADPGTPLGGGGSGAGVPVPGAEAGGAAWYGYALAAAAAATAAASSSPSSPSSAQQGGASASSSPTTAATVTVGGAGPASPLSSSPGSAGHGFPPAAGGGSGGGGSSSSPPISPSPSHAYPRSVRPTPLRKQVGTDDDDDDEEEDEDEHQHQHQQQSYPPSHYGSSEGGLDADALAAAQYAHYQHPQHQQYPQMQIDAYGAYGMHGHGPNGSLGPPPSSSAGLVPGTASSSGHGSTSSQHGRKSHEHEEDDDDDEFSPFGTARQQHASRSSAGGGAGYGGYGPAAVAGAGGMASSLVARMMAGTGSPLGPSSAQHPRRGGGSATASPSAFVRTLSGRSGEVLFSSSSASGGDGGAGMMYAAAATSADGHEGSFSGSPDFGSRGLGYQGQPGGGGLGHLQYLQSNQHLSGSGSGGAGGPHDVFSPGYQPDGGHHHHSGGGVSDAEFNELEAAIEAEEAERRRANMTPFDVLYSILNGTNANDEPGSNEQDTPPASGSGEGASRDRSGGGVAAGKTRWTPKQIETALARNGWDVEATLNWIMAGGGGGGGAKESSSSSSAATKTTGGAQQGGGGGPGGPLSSSLSSSASSSLSSSLGTSGSSSANSASTGATSATPRGGSGSTAKSPKRNGASADASGNAAAENGSSSSSSRVPAPVSTSLPHFAHHYVPGSTKPGAFASPRATFSLGLGGAGNGSAGSSSAGLASSGLGRSASGSGGAGGGAISYSNGVAVLPREAFQSHKGGPVGGAAGGVGGGPTSGTRSPRVGSPSLFHVATGGGGGGPAGFNASGPLTPSHLGHSSSSPLPSPGLNGPTTPGGSGATSRVCRYFLAGECRRFDCRFSHDLGRALCRFWLRGQCLNDPCGFLHDYDVVNKLARGMKGSLTPSASGSAAGDGPGGGDGYFAQRPGGGGDGGDATGSPGPRWAASSAGNKEGPTWVGRSASYRDRMQHDGGGAHSPGGPGVGVGGASLDFRAHLSAAGGGSGPFSASSPSASASGHGRSSGAVPPMTVPDADAPDEFPVLGRPVARDESGKKAGGVRSGAGGGPRWVLAASGGGGTGTSGESRR